MVHDVVMCLLSSQNAILVLTFFLPRVVVYLKEVFISFPNMKIRKQKYGHPIIPACQCCGQISVLISMVSSSKEGHI